MKAFFTKLTERFRATLLRFPLALLISAAMAGLMIAVVWSNDAEDDLMPIVQGLIPALFWSVFLSLARQRGAFALSAAAEKLIPVILAAAGAAAALTWTDNVYLNMALIGAAVAAVILTAAVLLQKEEDRQRALPVVVRGMALAGLTVAIAMAGIAVCLFAVDQLIHELADRWEILYSLGIAVVFFGGFNLFLSYLPAAEMPQPGGSYRTILNKVLFYLYLFLLGILYVYLIKILVSRQMPVGQLNWFGSLALLFFVFFALSLQKEDGALQRWFLRWGGLVLLPIVAMQLYAIWIRVSAYGLTTPRVVSLVLILMAVLFLIATLLRSSLGWVWMAWLALVLVFTVTPLNVVDVADRSQEAILKDVMAENGLLTDDGSVLVRPVLSGEDRSRFYGAYDYLDGSPGRKDDFVNAVLAHGYREYYAPEDEQPQPSAPETFRVDYEYEGQDEVFYDVASYTSVKQFHSWQLDDVEGYDLSGRKEFFLQEHDNSQPLTIVLDDGTALYVFSYSIGIEDGRLSFFSIGGLILKP